MLSDFMYTYTCNYIFYQIETIVSCFLNKYYRKYILQQRGLP